MTCFEWFISLTTLLLTNERAPARRALLVAVLLVGLFGLCLWYGTYGIAPDLGAYPTEQAVGPFPEEYVGDPVVLAGTVVGTDPVEIRIDGGGGHHRTITVTDFSAPVQRGDQLRVFGTLVDRDTVRTTNGFTVPPENYLYTYTVSFVAGLWVLVRLVGQWRLDPTGLVRRRAPRGLDDVRRRLTGDDDA
ncbi:hypothetical protein C2R22_15000 [Salinigranum rubrum]|uniref:DUF4131 domain-containing protein n=1 Tax=Salinigranum rubrum TaxID=755307 RepID=A0A2I8VLL9_9EURY|nr:hypothetical protein [Salinigranum rubrum]AUV82785.1 hypothetical protein C2R22_15000 [Salinigranum rubrum]